MTSTLLGNPDIRQLRNQTQGLLKGNAAPTAHRTGSRLAHPPHILYIIPVSLLSWRTANDCGARTNFR